MLILAAYLAAAAEGLVGVSLSIWDITIEGIASLSHYSIAGCNTWVLSPSLRSSWLINRTSLVKEGFVLWPKGFAGRERTISIGYFGHSGIKRIQRQDCAPLESATLGYCWSTVKLSFDGKIMGMEISVHGLS